MFKRRLLQYFLFWLYTFLSIGVPIWLIQEQYHVFDEPTVQKTATSIIIIGIFVLFYFRKHINKWVEEINPCFGKSLLLAFREILPLVILYGAFYGSYCLFNNEMVKLIFIVKWSGIANACAFGVRILHLRIRDYVNEYYKLNKIANAVNK